MKIAIVGHGKMGQAIERIALSRGHEIVAIIDQNNVDDIDSEAFKSADVAIEFTQPGVALENYRRILPTGVPLVSGTTGWGDVAQAERLVADNDAAMMWSSNYSVGVNIFFAVNRYLARIMNRFPQYTAEMEEVHHVHKLDHPSGTAKTLAEGIIAESDRLTAWTEDAVHAADRLQISHRREGEVPGIHTVEWQSPMDTITLTHSAKTRDSFALGAVIAAEWLPGHKGLLGMEDMMGELLR